VRFGFVLNHEHIVVEATGTQADRDSAEDLVEERVRLFSMSKGTCCSGSIDWSAHPRC